MQLTAYELDMFNEIGNVGVGNAATALSTMIGKKVNISLPTTKTIQKSDILNEITAEVLLVNSKIEGDLVGNVVVVYKKETAFPLIDLMCGNPEGTLQELDEMAKSAFKEMVNIIAGPYLDSLAQMMELRLLPKPPTFSYGKIISMKDALVNELPPNVGDILYVKTEMSIDGKMIFGDFYIILDQKSMEKIVKVLGKVC